jgi:hypothetical protein
MLIMGIVLVAGITLLAGCASPAPRYSKPGVAIQEQERDEAECAKAALGSDEGPSGVGIFLRVDRDTADQCMVARGYVVRPQP